MENISLSGTDVEELDLPQGFRFHPTDEELITQYLSKKVHDSCFCAKGIGLIELNKCEPWELPWIGTMVEKEWYFFFLRDKKFRNGSKTNRSTPAGYWKATGKEKEIRKAKALIGIKKTLVFYKGRTSYGEKTSWIMHEYRLEGILSKDNLPETANTDWTVGRFFQKNIVRRKNHISGMLKLSSVVKDPPSLLPPLMDSSPCVTCFSGPTQTENWKPETPIFFASSFSNPPDISIAAWNFPIATPIYHSTQIGNPQYPDRFLVRERPMKRKLIENHGPSTKQNQTAEFSRGKKFDADVSTVIYNSGMVHTSFHNREYSLASRGLLDIGCLWTY